MSFLIFTSLFLAVTLSGLSVFLFKSNNKRTIKLLLSFSGAYLLAITFLHLVPEIYIDNNSSIGIYILIGFFLQILLELFSEGIEHGHAHIHKKEDAAFPLAMMLSLCIHSFLEGMPLAYGLSAARHGHPEDEVSNPLLLGLILHKIPISIVLMGMFLQSKLKKQKAVFLLIILALMAPLGALTSYLIGEQLVNDMSLYFDKMLAIVIGIFLHISTTILFESSENHRFNIYKIITIALGAVVALLSL